MGRIRICDGGALTTAPEDGNVVVVTGAATGAVVGTGVTRVGALEG